MRTIAKLGSGLLITAAMSFALTYYHGQLVDAACYNQNPNMTQEKMWVKCAPTSSTTAFAIHANGKIRMLDQAGNDKVMTAMKRGDLKRDPNGDMPVVIDGYRHGKTIQVEGVRARGSNTSVH